MSNLLIFLDIPSIHVQYYPERGYDIKYRSKQKGDK